MTPIQQLLLGVGAKQKLYVDSVFDNTVYTGVSGSGVQFTNGIDMAGKKGMVWVKSRTEAKSWYVFDNVANTAQGANPSHSVYLNANTVTPINNTAYQVTMNSDGVTSPTTDDSDLGGSGKEYYMPMFRQAEGFFDIVTYTGNGSNRTISHSLGCVPGCIMIKNTSSSENWRVYHKDLTATKHLLINSDAAAGTSSTQFNDTEPTASVFSVGTDDAVNKNGDNYVAYIFAGGESTAATARSVDFDGSGDFLTLADSDDWILGNTFTIEFWLKMDSGTMSSSSGHGVLSQAAASSPATGFYILARGAENHLQFYDYNSTTIINSEVNSIYEGQWIHCALVNDAGTAKWYINGKASLYTANHNGVSYDMSVNTAQGLAIGAYDVGGQFPFQGSISNLRIVKGTAVYTSSFIPPTAPLTNITNTKLLCCNGSNVTDKTVGGTITSNGDPTSSANSPFIDPGAYKFGENGDQLIVKTGSYVGNGNAAGPIVELGFEPQFIFLKNSEISDEWFLFDSLRGFMGTSRTPGNARLNPNQNWDEGDQERIHLTSTGFKCYSNNGDMNGDNQKMIYVAIRRPDGYCAKPIETGTSALAMDTGNDSSTIPAFDSTFPVDMVLHRKPGTASQAWTLNTRLTRKCEFFTNTNGTETGGDADLIFDSNVGFAKNRNSDYQAWMFRRHKGFDVTTYRGTEVKGHAIRHNLGVKPEMIIVKQREVARDWVVLHKGLNGGNTYQNYTIKINSTDQAYDQSWFNDQEPTSTHFTVDNSNEVNGFNYHYIAMLFASIEGVSKVGYYAGSDSEQTITTGFQPRFVMLKRADASGEWVVLDTTRGWGSGNDQRIKLNTDEAQESGADVGAPTSTGFTLTGNQESWSNADDNYIYYAHA